MHMSLKELQANVRAQKDLIPSIYGKVDFDIVPERFTADLQERSMLPNALRKHRTLILADKERMERALAYTMLGDTVADAYAALMPQYRFRALINMLNKACEQGIESIENPPQELINFIASMERKPDWLDMKLVKEGARANRVFMANLTPFALRGAFIATFMNRYSGLPMALTGALSNESALQRVKETASFFTTACLPGALNRHGPGFRAAAMVRLMHSMVRFNILKNSSKWDVSVFGIPIPQVDQMPAGTMPAFVTAIRVIESGRKKFTRREQALVEMSRYQCYLLGLPEDLLPNTPQAIYDAMLTYAATLRDGYDDDTNGALVRHTMAPLLKPDDTLQNRLFNVLEKGFAKVFFTRTFQVSNSRARMMGVEPTLNDFLSFGAASLIILPRMAGHTLAERIPIINHLADKFLVDQLNDMLVSYGHAEYTTDPSKYQETSAPPAFAHGV